MITGKDSEVRTVVTASYDNEAEFQILEALDTLHGVIEPLPEEGETLNRTYVVVRFTESEHGASGSMGVFGNDPIRISEDDTRVEAATKTANTSLSTIVANTLTDVIEPLLGDVIEKARSIQKGANEFSKLPPEIQEAMEAALISAIGRKKGEES